MYSRETRALMEAAVDAVIVVDHQGRMLAVNEAASRMFGYTSDELMGQNVSVLMPPPDREAHDEYMRRYLDTGVPKIIGIGRQVTARRRDGSVFPARLSVGRVPDESPPRFVGLVRDISAELEATAALKLERDRAHDMQDRLTRVARLATMGEMASGMAHELNQPLTAITTYARACEHYLASSRPDIAEVRAAMREIVAEGHRAGEIIRRLRQMVRSDLPDPRIALDVNHLIEELRALLTADARAHGAQLRLTLPADLPQISASGVQLQQVVLNLARNAFEAVQELPAADRRVEIATANSAGEVEIQVSDNGPGVAPQIRERLFDPFASTKGAGTGLGLAISHTIVKSHGGTIGTRNSVTRGATFVVRLPALEECLT